MGIFRDYTPISSLDRGAGRFSEAKLASGVQLSSEMQLFSERKKMYSEINFYSKVELPAEAVIRTLIRTQL